MKVSVQAQHVKATVVDDKGSVIYSFESPMYSMQFDLARFVAAAHGLIKQVIDLEASAQGEQHEQE
jgi:hypothetical protein